MAVVWRCALAADLPPKPDLAGPAQLHIDRFSAAYPRPRCPPGQGRRISSRPAEADPSGSPAVDRWSVLLFVFRKGQALQNSRLDVRRTATDIRHCQGPGLLSRARLPYALRVGKRLIGALDANVAVINRSHPATFGVGCSGRGYHNCGGAHAAAGADQVSLVQSVE